MPLYLAPGTSSLLHAGGGALSGSEDCCCDDGGGEDFPDCGCEGGVGSGTVRYGAWDVDLSGVAVGGSCTAGQCTTKDGLYTTSPLNLGLICATTGAISCCGSRSTGSPSDCGAPGVWVVLYKSGSDYYIDVEVTEFITFAVRFRLNMGPDPFDCTEIAGLDIPFFSSTSTKCDWTGAICTLTWVP